MLCRSLFLRSQSGLLPKLTLHHLLECYSCTTEDNHPSYGDMGMPVPPFGCTFSTAPDVEHILAVANEEGFVRLYNTRAPASSKQVVKEWQAHSNAVFDLAWMPREHKIVTASGDQTAKLWDVRTGELLGVCKGHQCSLKSVSFSKFDRAVFCTGGRDGNIMVWDTRCNKKDGFYRQVKQISGAHNIIDKQTPSKLKKKKQNLRGLAPSVDFQQSVTVVLLQDEHTLISTGAVDGVIKIWDLRKNYTVYRQDPVPSRSFNYPGNCTRKLGYSSLVLDSTGTSLFANCTDDNIYMFILSSLKTTPVSVFSGHQNSSFYVKSSISPDDQFLISGSSDQNAYIWKVSQPQLPPILLQGHLQEVTSVAWCPSDFTKVSTCSDDNTVKIWRLKRCASKENWLDKSSKVGWTCQKKVTEQHEIGSSQKYNTPAKVLPVGSPPVSSPQAATCAPTYSGDLPLPTNTPTCSSVKTLTSKPDTPVGYQKEATSDVSAKPATSASMLSIRQWVTKTPSSCPGKERKGTSQEKQAKFSKRASASKTLYVRSEMRAKRRLESSKEVHVNCLKSCNCVAEPHSVCKKSRLDPLVGGSSEHQEEDLQTVSGLAQDTQSQRESDSSSSTSSLNLPFPTKASSGKIANKENGFPAQMNWLSALRNKLRTHKSHSSKGSGGSAPLSQEGRTSAITTLGSITAASLPMRKISTYFERKLEKN